MPILVVIRRCYPENFCFSFISVAVIKHYHQRKLGGVSLYFQDIVYHLMKSQEEVKQELYFRKKGTCLAYTLRI